MTDPVVDILEKWRGTPLESGALRRALADCAPNVEDSRRWWGALEKAVSDPRVVHPVLRAFVGARVPTWQAGDDHAGLGRAQEATMDVVWRLCRQRLIDPDFLRHMQTAGYDITQPPTMLGKDAWMGVRGGFFLRALAEDGYGEVGMVRWAMAEANKEHLAGALSSAMAATKEQDPLPLRVACRGLEVIQRLGGSRPWPEASWPVPFFVQEFIGAVLRSSYHQAPIGGGLVAIATLLTEAKQKGAAALLHVAVGLWEQDQSELAARNLRTLVEEGVRAKFGLPWETPGENGEHLLTRIVRCWLAISEGRLLPGPVGEHIEVEARRAALDSCVAPGSQGVRVRM